MAGRRIIVFALFAVAALGLALFAASGVEAQTFHPTNSYTLTNPTPGANSDSVIGARIAAPDLNYEDASMTILLPPDAWTATGLEAPIGARVGTLNASVAVGLLGGPCNSALGPNFTLYNASVDIAAPNGIPIDWILKPAGSYPPPDSDGDGLMDYMEQYPDFLNTMLDPDGSGPLLPLQPRARLAGHTTVASFNVLVQFLIFNPGQMTQLGGIYSQMTAEKGAPSFIVLNNPVGEGEATPGAISDFCTPLSTTTTLYGVTLDNLATAANEAGYTRQTNPPANSGVLASGTHLALTYAQSERNADGDHVENDLDGCRYTADITAWNPRVHPNCIPGSNPGDQDCDMLPSSCDPNDAANNTDQDTDGYDNGQDNCPQAANGCKDAACGPIFNPSWDNQDDRDAGLANTDLGPRSDAIGDACDDSDDDGNEDGGAAGDCNDGIDNGGGDAVDGADADCAASMDKVDWPPTTANPQNGTWYHGLPQTAVCVGGVDTDGDGYCAALETLAGTPDDDGAETGDQCTNAVDDDADTFVNDGCDWVGAYGEILYAGGCDNAISDDTPTPDVFESPAVVNDGCPSRPKPEGKLLDATITAPAALPAAAAPQSCSDGFDNDLDGNTDSADGGPFGCQAAGYAGDADFDGMADGSDNCPAVWNPTQTNRDNGFAATSGFPAGDALGDACDTDDDADGFTDTIEGHLPTDPLDRCRNGSGATRSDAWGLDQDLNATITVVGDVLKYSGKIGQSVSGNPPTSWFMSRLDLDGNRTITVVGDVLKYSGKIGASCT